MNEPIDIRWKQRFRNFLNAFSQLEDAVKLAKTRQLSQLEKQGLIQALEFTHELACNVLKDYLEYQGVFGLTGSRDTQQAAFQKGIIARGSDWMEMIKSRNLTSHTYNKKVSDEIILNIQERYFPSFCELKEYFQKL
jgi:nucleotidyltransferase substrate binding protein (TIGR01987 family)